MILHIGDMSSDEKKKSFWLGVTAPITFMHIYIIWIFSEKWEQCQGAISG